MSRAVGWPRLAPLRSLRLCANIPTEQYHRAKYLMIRNSLLLVPFLFFSLTSTSGQSLDEMVTPQLPGLLGTYKMLHAAPELSHYEQKTSAFLAKELRGFGYDVTEHVGKYKHAELVGYGVVAVLRNGSGPTVLVRSDMDALPVEEKTNLDYASRVRSKNDKGDEVPVMHACGHDVHITSLIGTARLLASIKDRWHGTLVLIGQPAEETVEGALAMLNDGLYSRFPRPDFALALHDSATLETGKVGYTEGYAMASSDSVNVTIRGLGGHGASPQTTKDPVVVAAQVVLALQTIVSRENSPLDPAVVTIGSIHGGTKRNIIPDEVQLQLTVRTYREEVRQRVLASIERISKGIALAAGIPPELSPIVELVKDESAPSTYNNPELTRRLAGAWVKALGQENAVNVAPIMASEDFGRFSLESHQIPSVIFWIGAVDPPKIERSRRDGTPLPSLHSSLFAPVPEPTIRTAIKAMSAAVLELMGK
jgi:amidohydrolase